MTNRRSEYWFPAKRFGYGWGIANTWQGGAIQLSYLLLMTVGTKFMVVRGMGAAWAVSSIALTIAFVWLHYRKGEPARWRWGND
ncbi:MAG TPA: hypothetical protein VK629_00445 [Steroidobacteraceae bacterium]|nr:hypothetical protein [Steroidobacteraceae bacterium]